MSIEIEILKEYKSIKPHEKFELPDFTVITGKNGSSKTHLLEALANSSISRVNIGTKSVVKINYIPFNGLSPIGPERSDLSGVFSNVKVLWTEFQEAKRDCKSREKDLNAVNILDVISSSEQRNKIQNVLTKSDKSIDELSEDDFFNYYYQTNSLKSSIFSNELAAIFKSYQYHQIDNIINDFYSKQEKFETKQSLSEDEFIRNYGKPPWQAINSLLETLESPYEINSPEGDHIFSSFELKLTDRATGVAINFSDLSTGEKVLMSIALAAYNITDDTGKPDLVLIDEPDAGLHPSMSNTIIQMINRYLVKENNIPTIITTHSPTTIINCEGISIYRMERGNSIPIKISVQDAIEDLTNDVPYLKVSKESRRQVFVESKYDVQYYEKIKNIYFSKIEMKTEPIFIPARTSIGSNCSDVITIVNSLYENGNDQVYGIIDWDKQNVSKDRILVLGENDRYAIENYLLDPLLVGLLLLREDITWIQQLPELKYTKYIDLTKLEAEGAQLIIDKVLKDLSLDSESVSPYETYNGWNLKTTEEFNTFQGHSLENKIKEVYPNLKLYHNENELKIAVIDNIINDFPGYAPKELIVLLERIN